MAKGTSVKEKKALIVLPYLRNEDGTAVALMNYYDSLIHAGWKLDFMHLKTFECEWVEKVKKSGGEIFEIPADNKYSKNVYKYIKEVFDQNDYSVVHLNIPGHIGFLIMKYAKKANTKVRIFHVHNPKNNIKKRTFISQSVYDQLIQKKATNLCACTESAGLSRFGSKHFEVVRNVVDVDRFEFNLISRSKIRTSLNLDNKTVIGVVCRFAAQKNPYFLVDCFVEYKKRNPRAFLLWLGDGELKESTKQYIKSKQIEGSYFLAGIKTDVEDWYCAMDLFLLPSFFEGLGIVFLEAQCTGLPCLGSKNVPVETEITNLMYRMDLTSPANEWADEMVRILSKREERVSRKKEFIDRGYTHETTKDGLVNFYNSLI